MTSVLVDTFRLLDGAVLVLLVVFLLAVALLTRDVARDLRRRPPDESGPGSDDVEGAA